MLLIGILCECSGSCVYLQPALQKVLNARKKKTLFDRFQKPKEMEKTVKVEEIDGVRLVKNLAVKMEEMFRKKAEATRVCTFKSSPVFMKIAPAGYLLTS